MSTDPEVDDDDLMYLVTHVFCPLRLPTGDDHSASKDLALSKTIFSSACAYEEHVCDTHRPEWNRISAMLYNLSVIMQVGALPGEEGEEVESQLKSMNVGDVNVYLIRAQNAAVVFRKQQNQMLFEAFEISPKAEAVMGAQGKLVCSYPGPAVEIPDEVFEDEAFRSELANFLVHMDHDTIADAVPITKKAGSDVEETRDTVDPRYVTELLTGILRGVGRPADIVRISKRIGDDVVWTDSLLPWRRSSLWLVIRVSLQTTLEQTALGWHAYKTFMLFLMHELAQKAIKAEMSSELLHFMSTKISRRLMKLGSSAPEWLSCKALQTCTSVREILEARWKLVQNAQAASPPWDPHALDPARDTQLSLLNSRRHICDALMKQGANLPRGLFCPTHRRRGTLQDFLSLDGKFFEDAYRDEPHLTLYDVEQAVKQGIDAWVAPILGTDVADADAQCVQLETLAEKYSSRAQEAYRKNPEDLSVMFLTTIEIWVALDKVVVKKIPMLGDYSPEVPLALLERLLLRKSESLHRLRLAYQYICDRHSRARCGWSVFSDTVNHNSFSVRYYNTSHRLQTLRALIQQDAQHARDEKLGELQTKNAYHAELGRVIVAMEHTYVDCRHYNWLCSRCERENERDRMTIDIHEWPLPSLANSAAMVVFELHCPTSFNMWRSATFHLLVDLCSSHQRGSPYILLDDYPALQPYYKKHPRSRITLASDAKPFIKTHYRGVSIPSTSELVCLDNGLKFYGFDKISSMRASNAFTEIDNSDVCTYQLPAGAYHNLQEYIKSTSHTSNEVIANQEDCHKGLSIDEFIAFGHLRSGSSLQWLNVLRELRARTLTFRHHGVHLLLAQAAGQVGQLSEGEWSWHQDLADPLFGGTLLGELESLVSRVKANWLETVTMGSVSLLISRLLASNQASDVMATAHRLLRKVRKTTFCWVQELAVKVRDVENEEIRGRLRDIAAICRSTFDIDPDGMREQLSSPRDVEILVFCAILIHDSTPAVLTGIPKESRLLHERDRRLSMASEEILANCVQESSLSEGINLAITRVWCDYRPGSQWKRLDHPNSRWISCQTARTDAQQPQGVHFNLVNGALLVEGKPLGTLPREFTGHSLYKLIFGSRVLDVIPGCIPGMEYTTRGQISGWQVHFAMKGDELHIKAGTEGHLFELIPQRKLQQDLPTPLVEGHAHWLSLSDWTIEVRPLDKRWERRSENWQIYLAPGSYSMRQGSAMLVDIRSQTWTMIADLLEPLERRDNLFIKFFPYQSVRGIPAPRLVVELPRYGISFFVDNDGDLQSFNMRDMVYDKNQSIGTMFGLVNQLVLRPKIQVGEELIQRCVLIPEGDVSFKRHGHHVQVKINTPLRRVTYETYKVDTELNCLTGNVGLTNKLYRAYLHAVTSSGCSTDPLTGKTGTEEALSILKSANCQSFMKMDPHAPKLLSLIGSLVPQRLWYPPHLHHMQNVEWKCLPATSQHHGLYFAAESIKKRWERDQMFRENQPISFPFPIHELHLLERASLRAAPLYPHAFSDPVPRGKCDTTYGSRDLVRAGNEDHAYSTAFAVFKWASTQNTIGDILQQLQSWGGTLHRHAPGFSLRYSKDWLRPDLSKTWLTAYDACRRSDIRQRPKLLFSLAAMAYGSSKCKDLVPTLLAFATVPAFSTIDPPPYKSFELSDGFVPSTHILREYILSTARRLEDSPERSIPKRFWETDSEWSTRQRSEYGQRLNSDTDAAVKELLAGWPRRSPPSCRSLSTSSFDLSSLANKLDPLFTSCYQNLQLQEHLSHVQQILDRAHASAPVLESFTFQPSSGKHTPDAPVVTLAYLFKRPALRLQPIPRLPHGVAHSDELSLKSVRLRQLIDGLRGNAQSRFQEQYAEDLRLSEEAFRSQTSVVAIQESVQHTEEVLRQHYAQLRGRYFQDFEALKQSLNPKSTNEGAVSCSGQWPRITVKIMLQSLASTSRITPPDNWRESITSFALLTLEVQRCRRLLVHAMKNQSEELSKELTNEGCDGWEAELHPDWLLIQLEGNFLVRRIQAEIAYEMISPQSGENTTMQLNMGEGKSSVIVPISVAALADSDQLVRVVVPKALTTQMFQLLVDRLGGLTNRRIYYLPFSRSLKIGPEQVSALFEIISECMRDGGILVVQPDHLLSLKLMSVEKQLDGDAELKDTHVAAKLLKLQKWLQSHARDILDESDEILHARYQLVYTMGLQKHLEGFPERWTTTQQILGLVRKHASSLRDRFPLGMEFECGLPGSFPHTRILRADPGRELISRIAQDVMDGLLPNFSFNHVRSKLDLRNAIRHFISHKDITPSEVQLVKDHFQEGALWKGLLLLRGLLASGILQFVLRERRWRVDYGLALSRIMLAVPYRAKDFPAPRAEFGHPDVAIVLTCLSYYYGGLTKDQFKTCSEILSQQDDPELVYESWIHDLTPQEVPDCLRSVKGINIESSDQWEQRLAPLFGYNKAVIDFYLVHVVFPKEAKEFPEKLSCSGWDLAENKNQVTTGFSGTNDGRYLLPTSITQCDPDHQRATNAKVLAYLLQPENNHYICTVVKDGGRQTAREFLTMLVSQKPEIRVLLDVGAQMLELQNRALAATWLELKTDAQAAIYVDDDDELMVCTRDGNTRTLVSSPFAQQLDKCVVYLDDAHTRGIDLKFPLGFRAAVTLGPKVGKDRLVQGCMRMRKLGHGHSVMFFAPREVDQSIRSVRSEGNTGVIDAADILRWTILETCNDIQHRAPQWAQQGADHASRYGAWSSYCDDKLTSEQLAMAWLQPEAKSLENLYAPAQSDGLVECRDPRIRQRLSDLGILSVGLSGMDEEQEREVVHEIERERQIERPPKAHASEHQLHRDLNAFVQLGSIPQESTAFLKIFESLTNTSAAFTECHRWTEGVFATADFCKTIQLQPRAKVDDYMRAVNWVISSNVAPILVVVSSYEVDKLLPKIRSSKTVHLHVYTPRIVQSMPPCDDLKLHSIPTVPAPWNPPLFHVDHLNVFAGQLYLRDYTTYIRLCRFLCIYARDLEHDGDFEVQSDGFIKPEDRPPNARASGSFLESPVASLKNLFGIRRKGMPYAPTHMGKILDGRFLTEEDFRELDSRQLVDSRLCE